MNQSFALDLTPAIARRLCFIAGLCHLDLDADVLALADTDRWESDGPSTHRAMVQFALDCGLRCVLDGSRDLTLDRIAVLAAVAAAGASPITVASEGCQREWRDALARAGHDPIAVHSVRTLFEADEDQRQRREGVLIFDWQASRLEFTNTMMIHGLCREFPRTIIHVDPAADLVPRQMSFADLILHRTQVYRDWWTKGLALFPQMPAAPFRRSLDRHQMARDWMPHGLWHTHERDDLAIFYNVFLPDRMSGYGQPAGH